MKLRFKTYLLALYWGVGVMSARALADEKAEVPATAPSALGLPAAVNTSKSMSRETEIRELWAAGKMKQAEKNIQSWMKSDKKNPTPRVLLAEFRFQQKKYKRCLSLSQKAIDLFPQSAEAYYWHGRAFEMLKKPLDAANEYKAALLAKKTYADAQIALNRVRAEIGTPTDNSTVELSAPESVSNEKE